MPEQQKQLKTEEEHEIKLYTCPLQIKQLDEEARTFEGLAATWDRDLGGDIIKKGAFRETLKQWKADGNMPLLDSHNWFSIRDGIGVLIDAKETDEGLWTKWWVVDGPDGDAILARLRPNPITGKSVIDSMSIGYRAIKWEIDEGDGTYEDWTRTLKEVELHEVSLVLFPMNPAARIDSASVKEFAASIKSMVDRFPEQYRGELRAEIRTAVKPRPDDLKLDRKEKPVLAKEDRSRGEAETRSTEPERKKAPAPKAPAKASSADDDRGAPDTSLYDQLRLRRLDNFREQLT